MADRVLILENAYYSVISPEACSAILWKDRKHAPGSGRGAQADLARLNSAWLVDEIVPEPEGGAHRDHDLAAANLGAALRRNLKRALETPIDELLKERYAKSQARKLCRAESKNGA